MRQRIVPGCEWVSRVSVACPYLVVDIEIVGKRITTSGNRAIVGHQDCVVQSLRHDGRLEAVEAHDVVWGGVGK